ncbi:hypothetical protein [Silvanigrella aquatica]|uniref:hypothetical protein n=1 Tax=Silvanigrella aquatica TaxID=1915309 RepID=UPI000A54CEF8|nr:hypothetical protein [Silvanigrella aquatica]
MKLLSKTKILYNKYSRLLPWASLIWGIGSSFLLTRDYSKATRLGIFTCAFFILIILMSTWYSYINSISSQNRLNKLHLGLHKKKELFEFIGLTATQYFIQYIFMFCIPFLYFKEEWIWLFFLVFFVGMTLWDPFWVRLFKIQFFRLLLRLIASCLVFGFLYAVLFPTYLDFYYVFFSIICFIAIFPWNSFVINRKIKVSEMSASFILTLIIACHPFIPSDYQFPVISIWIENSKFSFNKPGKETFKIIKGNIISRNELMLNLSNGKKLCAITPVVAPLGVFSVVYQEWYVDNKFLESIVLPKISGSEILEKYNTFSCKKYFMKLENAKKLTIKTYLKNGIYVGTQSLIISD